MKSFMAKMRARGKSNRYLEGLARTEPLESVYEIGEGVGRGSFSEVKVATKKATGEYYAVKIINKASCLSRKSLAAEVNILKNTHHECIVNLYETYEDDENAYLILDLMLGGELYERICDQYPSGYTERIGASLIKQVLQGISFIHSKGIIHRDLKPENLLFAQPGEDDIRISDFGLAKVWSAEVCMITACGTAAYAAPEVLRAHDCGYTSACDMWSIGVITYALLCGYCPFNHTNQAELYRLITEGKFTFDPPFWEHVSTTGKDFISRLLKVSTKERMTADEALLHPWITGKEEPNNKIYIDWALHVGKRGAEVDADERQRKKTLFTNIAKHQDHAPKP